jgi:Ca2+-binding RTX toxin-like protein
MAKRLYRNEWIGTIGADNELLTNEHDGAVVYLLAGDDSISTAFDGQFFLGSGNDLFTSTLGEGGASYQVVYGGGGDDRVLGGSVSDYLVGGSGNDSLSAAAGADRLFGDCYSYPLMFCEPPMPIMNPGVDTLLGGEGDDLLHGGGLGDWLSGGAGSDLFVWEQVDDFGDTITGFDAGPEGDRLFFNGLIVPTGATPKLTDYFSFGVSGLDTRVFLDRDGAGTAHSAQLVATLKNVALSSFNPEQLIGFTDGLRYLTQNFVSVGSEWGDTYSRTVADWLSHVPGSMAPVYMLAGNDTVSAEIGGGFIAMGDGDDRFAFVNPSVSLPFSLGAYVNGGRGNDTLAGGGDDDELRGGSGADSLTGGRETISCSVIARTCT